MAVSQAAAAGRLACFPALAAVSTYIEAIDALSTSQALSLNRGLAGMSSLTALTVYSVAEEALARPAVVAARLALLLPSLVHLQQLDLLCFDVLIRSPVRRQPCKPAPPLSPASLPHAHAHAARAPHAA